MKTMERIFSHEQLAFTGARGRALFYVFDAGSGIGHLRRLARIAEAMSGDFSCLIVTGHDIAPQWIVPQGCEYVRLPSWDNLITSKAAYWGRKPFIDLSLQEAVAFRSAMLLGVMEGFRPDALFVDHLPLGAHGELATILRTANCRKYLVTRGIQNETEDLQRLVLGGEAMESLGRDYDRILSAIDPQVFEWSSRYGLHPDIVEKICSVGYVAPLDLQHIRRQARRLRGIDRDAPWVVVSAGGGQWGEPLIEACLNMAQYYPEVYFDVVMGPRSRLATSIGNQQIQADGRVRIWGVNPELAAMHASADVVVTTGGYNSLLEALQGCARIICVPYRTDPSDEPFQHATFLSRYVDLVVTTEIGNVQGLLSAAIDACRQGAVNDRRGQLQMDGASAIAQLALNDLRRGSKLSRPSSQ
jgi:predicted glycosyltransferase